MTHQLSIDFNLTPHFWNFDEISFEEDGQHLFDLIIFCQQNDIVFNIEKWVGPGGGNNWITFCGTYDSLKKFGEKYELVDFEEFIEKL